MPMRIRQIPGGFGQGSLFRPVRATANNGSGARHLVMKDGRIVAAGSTERVMAAPAHPYTRALTAAAFDLATAPA